MNEIENLLRDEVVSELESLNEIEKGTAEYKAVVDGIIKLADRAIEIEKIEIEKSEKAMTRENAAALVVYERELKERQVKEAAEQAEFEKKLKLKQMEDERKDRLVKNGIALAGIILPLVLAVWGTYKSFEFEKDGTVTTIMGRGYINKLLPKK